MAMKPWLRFFRLPNLFTAPGDALAGCALAAAWAKAPPHLGPFLGAGLASLALYAFGLGLNDLVDLGRDRVHRPERPLPRGDIGRLAALAAVILALLVGLALAALCGPAALEVGLALVVAILIYDLVAKRFSSPAPYAMAACRSLSVLLGAAATGRLPPPAWLAALGTGAYIASLTWLSDQEETGPSGWLCYLPVLFHVGTGLVVAAALLTLLPARHLGAGLLLAVPGWVTVAWVGHGLRRRPSDTGKRRQATGRLIHALLPLQAGLLACAIGRVPFAAACLALAAWPVARWLGRHYSAS